MALLLALTKIIGNMINSFINIIIRNTSKYYPATVVLRFTYRRVSREKNSCITNSDLVAKRSRGIESNALICRCSSVSCQTLEFNSDISSFFVYSTYVNAFHEHFYLQAKPNWARHFAKLAENSQLFTGPNT